MSRSVFRISDLVHLNEPYPNLANFIGLHPLNCLCDRCERVRGKTVTEICDPADQFENIWPDALRAEDV